MAITQTQITAIATRLAVDLSVVSNDRLIELCLLHRAAPDALPSFLVGLETELVRRFTAQYIAANDVIFAVLQNFANNFASPVPYFQMQMIQMAATVNRDIWFQNNTALFTASIDDIDVMTWLVTQPDILQKCLNNSFGLMMIAQSTTASTAILTHEPAVALWKQADNLWSIWSIHAVGMTVLAKSSELMSYVAASSTAMTAVIASSTALSKIVVSTSARTALMSNNAVLQGVKLQIYNTVRASWIKQVGIGQAPGSGPSGGEVLVSINNAVSAPKGFVFASLGYHQGQSTAARTEARHPNNSIAATAGSSPSPANLNNLDVVTFDGAVFTTRVSYGAAYAELWIPPTT